MKSITHESSDDFNATKSLRIDFTPLSLEAKEYFHNKFLPRVEAIRKDMKNEVLALVVWGPADPQNPLCQVRIRLLNELRRLGHAAFFSEELSKANTLSLRIEEYLQARASDFIINIKASPGSIAEFHDFDQFKSIAQNMLIVVDDKDRFGYSDLGALREHELIYGKVIRYKNTDEISNKVLDIIQLLQIKKYLAHKIGEDWRL